MNQLFSASVVRCLAGDCDIVWVTLGHTSSSDTHEFSRFEYSSDIGELTVNKQNSKKQ